MALSDLRAVGLLVLVFGLTGLTACQKKPKQTSDPSGFSEISRNLALRRSAHQRGKAAAQALLVGLKGRLLNQIKTKGLVEALTFCSREGLPITAELAKQQGVQIRRTSLKFRNPKNAPDALDRQILVSYAAIHKNGRPLRSRLVPVKTGFRFYRPLKVEGVCLSCHGDQVTPPVKAALLKLYPKDLAIGYKINDFRGVVRVDLPSGKSQ